MAQTIKTRRRGQGTSALAFMNRRFNSGANEVYKDTGENGLGRCETHKGIHVKREDCKEFELASVKDIAEDTWRKLTAF